METARYVFLLSNAPFLALLILNNIKYLCFICIKHFFLSAMFKKHLFKNMNHKFHFLDFFDHYILSSL